MNDLVAAAQSYGPQLLVLATVIFVILKSTIAFTIKYDGNRKDNKDINRNAARCLDKE